VACRILPTFPENVKSPGPNSTAGKTTGMNRIFRILRMDRMGVSYEPQLRLREGELSPVYPRC
jgi:hypothetical protein